MMNYLGAIYDTALIFYPLIFITCLVWAYSKPTDKNIVFHLHTVNQLTLALTFSIGFLIGLGGVLYALYGIFSEDIAFMPVTFKITSLGFYSIVIALFSQIFWLRRFRKNLLFSWIALILCFSLIVVKFFYDFGNKDYITYSFAWGMFLYGVEFVLLYITVGRK